MILTQATNDEMAAFDTGLSNPVPVMTLYTYINVHHSAVRHKIVYTVFSPRGACGHP